MKTDKKPEPFTEGWKKGFTDEYDEPNPLGGWADGVSDYDPYDSWKHRLYVIIKFLGILIVIGLVLWFLTSLGG